MSAKTLAVPAQRARTLGDAKPWPKAARLFWLGLVAAGLGAGVETVFMLLTRHRLMNRSGLLYGQLSLVWGLGAILFTVVAGRKKHGVWGVFFSGMAVGTAFEYLCSWFQEECLGMVFWDYSHLPLSIGGRVNLLFSVFWGGAATVWVCLALPLLDALLERFPTRWRGRVTSLAAILLAADVALTLGAFWRLDARQRNVPPRNGVEAFLDARYPDQRLYDRFTGMVRAEEYIVEHPAFHP